MTDWLSAIASEEPFEGEDPPEEACAMLVLAAIDAIEAGIRMTPSVWVEMEKPSRDAWKAAWSWHIASRDVDWCEIVANPQEFSKRRSEVLYGDEMKREVAARVWAARAAERASAENMPGLWNQNLGIGQ